MTFRTTDAIAILLALPGVRLEAGCGATSLGQYLKHRDVVAIFRATVTLLEAVPPSLSFPRDIRQIATMKVASVWKGNVTPETRVYFHGGEGGPANVMRDGGEYLVIAHVLSAESRPWFRLSPSGDRALGANELGCGVVPVANPSAVRMMGEAPGYPPQ